MELDEYNVIYNMDEKPNRDGWVLMLHNKRLESVGNDAYAETMWYNKEKDTLSPSETSENGVEFNKFLLRDEGGLPQAWKYTSNN